MPRTATDGRYKGDYGLTRVPCLHPFEAGEIWVKESPPGPLRWRTGEDYWGVGVLHTYSKQSSRSVKLRSLILKIKARPDVAVVASPLPRRAKHLNPEQSAQLAENYRQGMKVWELAKKYDIHRATVADHLAFHGVAKRARGLMPDQITEASDRYRTGESLASLGRAYSVSADTIRKGLCSSGVKMRNPWDHPGSDAKP